MRIRGMKRLFLAVTLGMMVSAGGLNAALARDDDDAPSPAANSPVPPPSLPVRPAPEAEAASRAASPADTLHFGEEVLRRGGIETAPLRPAPAESGMEAYATVLDPTPLIELSNDLAGVEAQLQAAKAKYEASRTVLERARKLYKTAALVVVPQLQAAEATALSDQAALAAVTAQKRNLTTTARRNWGEVLGPALLSGSAAFRRLAAGRDMLLLLALPPGKTLSETKDGLARLPGGAPLPLHFVSAATRADPRLQGMSYYYTAKADGTLLPQMRLPATLPEGRAMAGGRIVPEEAVVRWQGAGWVYLRTRKEGFVRRRVAMDRLLPGGAGYLVADLPEDAEIVVRGAALLLSEELKAQTRDGDTD